MPLKTTPFDAADYLKDDPEGAADFLADAFESGDIRVILAAMGAVARAQGMTDVAARAGLGRESLYKALSPSGSPKLSTVLQLMPALGLTLTARRP